MPSRILAYVTPPLMGAFIGYLTNMVAIRMLFRPLRPWRVLGLRLPMTPGVIPGKRRELARNIGEMVGAHLLTSADISAALSEERFQEHLRLRVDGFVSNLLARDLGPLKSLVPERFQAYLTVAVRTLKYQARLAIRDHVRSEEFAHRLSQAVREQLQVMGERPLNSLVSPAERQAAYGFVDRLVGELLAGEATAAWLAGHLRENLRQAAAQERIVADYLPLSFRELVVETIRQRSPDLLQQLGRLVAEPAVRDRIIGLARGAVDDFIGRLGPVGILARGFLNMNRLEGAFRDYLVGKEGQIRAWLDNEEVQEHFRGVLVEQAEKFLRTPVARLLAGAGEEQLESACREVAWQALALLRTPGVLASLSALLRERFEALLGQGDRGVGELGEQILGRGASRLFVEAIAGETLALLRSHRAGRLVDRMFSSMSDAFLNRPLGVLSTLLPQGVRVGLTDYAVLTINRILLREVPSIVDSLNIRQMVTDKVDSLDLLRLERLLLSIMEEQFQYINLFGALLGFLLGLLNLLVPVLQ